VQWPPSSAPETIDVLTLERWSMSGQVHSYGVLDGSRVGGLVGFMNIGLMLGVGEEDQLVDCAFDGDVVVEGSTGMNLVGGIVGHLASGGLNRCTVAGAVKSYDSYGDYIGGLVGLVGGMGGDGHIYESSSSADVHGSKRVGGLVGSLSGDSSIERSFASGSVSAEGPPVLCGVAVGGLVGFSINGLISDSYALGSVVGEDLYRADVGGLVGQLRQSPLLVSVQRSFSAGLVTKSTTLDDYGDVSGRAGGLLGWGLGWDGTWWALDSFIPGSTSYWDMGVSGLTASADGEGKTTAEMTVESTFVDWDFSEATGTWKINDGVSYPCLQWQEGDCPVP